MAMPRSIRFQPRIRAELLETLRLQGHKCMVPKHLKIQSIDSPCIQPISKSLNLKSQRKLNQGLRGKNPPGIQNRLIVK